jgi:preprotein translocase subunit SecE
MLTTAMVLLMATLAAIFFFLIDKLIQWGLVWTVGVIN